MLVSCSAHCKFARVWKCSRSHLRKVKWPHYKSARSTAPETQRTQCNTWRTGERAREGAFRAERSTAQRGPRGASTACRYEMPPCEVELLACGPSEYVGAQALDEGLPRKRPAAAVLECPTSGGRVKSKFGTACAVPYKKRKLKKCVKFSPASRFRVVECVPGEWCEDAEEPDEDDASPGGPPDADSARAAHAHESEAGEADACAQDAGRHSPPASPAAHARGDSPGFACTPSSPSVLHDEDIVTKDGDGPSTIGLICNALIMGLVDRSITNSATALEAMRAVIQAAEPAAHEHSSSRQGSAPPSPMASDEAPDAEPRGSIVIGDEVFDSVVERLQQLVEHLDRYQRVGLLPSTARLGRSFVPALKCLQGTLRVAAREQYAVDSDKERRGEREEEEEEEETEIKTPRSRARDEKGEHI